MLGWNNSETPKVFCMSHRETIKRGGLYGTIHESRKRVNPGLLIRRCREDIRLVIELLLFLQQLSYESSS